mmetsp:Transcript_41442/g.114191  ORF Transcript_41442/g.114191 Transcript_41442/m.114191 type:complete len:225 (-) Transcript_41442:624-1298(-)
MMSIKASGWSSKACTSGCFLRIVLLLTSAKRNWPMSWAFGIGSASCSDSWRSRKVSALSGGGPGCSAGAVSGTSTIMAGTAVAGDPLLATPPGGNGSGVGVRRWMIPTSSPSIFLAKLSQAASSLLIQLSASLRMVELRTYRGLAPACWDPLFGSAGNSMVPPPLPPSRRVVSSIPWVRARECCPADSILSFVDCVAFFSTASQFCPSMVAIGWVSPRSRFATW